MIMKYYTENSGHCWQNSWNVEYIKFSSWLSHKIKKAIQIKVNTSGVNDNNIDARRKEETIYKPFSFFWKKKKLSPSLFSTNLILFMWLWNLLSSRGLKTLYTSVDALHS